MKWAEVGFRYKSNGAFCTLFLKKKKNFGLNHLFRPFQPIRPESARFHANRLELEPCQRESAKNTWNPRGTMRLDTAGREGSSVPGASPRPATSDAGVAPLVPRPCFIGNNNLFGCEKREDMAEERVW